jgi:3-hydroxyisobutyrate dehydrogenase
MLPSSPHVRDVYLNKDSGILAGLRSAGTKNALLIDSSTIDPQSARDVALAAAEVEVGQHDMVDAPVSGGVGGAEAGTLTFMVGAASDKSFARVQPVLARMGKNIVHCGGAGTGQVAKVCNNVILGMSMAAVAEGMALGVKLGMDPKVLAGILNTSSARCWSSEIYNPCPGVVATAPASRGYTGGFGVQLMLKDMGLATSAGRAAGQALPMAQLAEQLYADIVKQGGSGKDFSFIYEHLLKMQAESK